jgi:outer membrane protein W
VVATGSTAHAQSSEAAGWTASLYGTLSRLGDTDVDRLGGSNPASGTASFGNGFGFGGAVGWRYGNGWATEVAWDYRRHDLERWRGVAGTLASDGDYASNALFVNAYRRFPSAGWTPYLGAGLGWVQEIDFDLGTASDENSHSAKGRAAWQLIAGAERALGPRWSVFGDVRYMNAGSPTLKSEAMATELRNARYAPWSLHLGARIRF